MSSIAVPAAAAVAGNCDACGRARGGSVACQFCGHIDGAAASVRLASPGKRFGGYLLEGVLMAFTLLIGWLVWALIVFSRGQTPAKQLLGMRVMKLQTGERATWGTMFLREFIAKWVIGVLSFFTLGIVNFWLVWDKSNQELWDKVVGTVVVNDPDNAI